MARTHPIVVHFLTCACALTACRYESDPGKGWDLDGDGQTSAEGDCDDEDASTYSGAQEVWYDGVDQNCDTLSDHDADGDGADQPDDCDDTNPDIYPGAPDAWYDGLDFDCGGNDDYDRDGDEHVANEYAGLPTEGVEGSGDLPGGDCDDGSADVNPGQPDEWYNGVDEDCGGDDDYDQDGDGYIYDTYLGQVTVYVDGSGELPGGDCDDLRSNVYPGAVDAWYDGVDTDCGGEDDYDQDADGYVPSSYVGDETQYVEGSGELPGGDCDDTAADVLPGALELLGDGVDQDCDSGMDTFELNRLDDLVEYTLTAADTPRLTANGTTLFLAITAEVASLSTEDSNANVSNGVPIIALARETLHSPSDVDLYSMMGGTSYAPDHTLVFRATDGYLYGGYGQAYVSAGNDYFTTRFGVVDLATGLADSQSGGSTEDSVGIDLLGFNMVIDEDEENAYLFATFSEDPSIYASCVLDDYRIDGDIECEVVAPIMELNAGAVGLELRPDESDYPILLANIDNQIEQIPLEIDSVARYTYAQDGSADLTSSGSLPYDPDELVMVQDPDGATWRIFYDLSDDAIYALDEDDVATTIQSGLGEVIPVQAAFADDGRLFVIWAEDGVATLVYGSPSGGVLEGPTEVAFTADFAIESAAVWVGSATDGEGLDLAVAALSADNLALGTARILSE